MRALDIDIGKLLAIRVPSLTVVGMLAHKNDLLSLPPRLLICWDIMYLMGRVSPTADPKQRPRVTLKGLAYF